MQNLEFLLLFNSASLSLDATGEDVEHNEREGRKLKRLVS